MRRLSVAVLLFLCLTLASPIFAQGDLVNTLTRELSTVTGVQSLQSVSVLDNIVGLEVCVASGSTTQQMAQRLRTVVVQVLGTEAVEFTAILDDGRTAVDYTKWTFDDWNGTRLSFTASECRALQSTPTRPSQSGTSTEQFYTVVASQAVNVRSEPSTSASVVTSLRPDTIVDVVDEVEGSAVSGNTIWYEIELDGDIAYIHSSLVQLRTARPTATPTPTRTPTPRPQPTRTPVPATSQTLNDTADSRTIRNGLTMFASDRNIISAEVVNGRPNGGERAVLIAYRTTETTDAGFLEEWLDIYFAVGVTIDAQELDVDSVSLIAGTRAGAAAGILVADTDDLLAWCRGRLSDTAFINRLTIVPL
jgi:hypothetical protein